MAVRRLTTWLLCYGMLAVLAQGLPVAIEASQTPARVAVIHPPKGSSVEAARSLANALERKGHQVQLFTLDNSVWAKVKQFKPDLVASGGKAATQQALANTSCPVTYFMVPNVLDADFAAPGFSQKQRISGVSSDVPASAWLKWVKQAHPKARTVAVLYSPNARKTAESLSRAGSGQGLKVVTIQADRKAFPNAIDALTKERPDAVVMIPDAGVYTVPNVKRLLLWGAREKRAVFTFSRSLVEAGAFCGLTSDPRQIGQQAADLVSNVLVGGQGGLQYPRNLEACMNTHTAEMIDVEVTGALRKRVELVGGRK